jgi:glycosyltransferase involved in cell wall biosynthesis
LPGKYRDDKKKDIFLVIPAYNEAKVIATTLQELIESGFSVVVVDDGSSDNTWEIIRHLPLFALRHPVNMGQGAALQTGMSFALLHGAEVIVHFDADGQHNLADIDNLIQPIVTGEAEVVFGSRFLRPLDTQQVPALKRVVLKTAIVVNGLFTGVWLTDAHNGFRALSRHAAQRIKLSENGFTHASEILMRVREQKLKYVECPTTIIYSHYSKSKGQSIWNAVNILIDLVIRRTTG